MAPVGVSEPKQDDAAAGDASPRAAPVVVSADELARAVAEAQQALLGAAATRAKGDETRMWLGAQSDALGALLKSTVRWERATADVIEVAREMAEAERDPGRLAQLLAGLIGPELRDAVQDGAGQAMQAQARRFVRTLDRKLAMQLGAAVGGAFAAGCLAASLLWWQLSAGPWSTAAAWRDVVAHNADPRPALAAAEVHRDANGRRYGVVSLWLDPVPPAPRQ